MCIYTYRKIKQFFCGFSNISVGIFETHRKITNFSVCIEKHTQKNVTPTEVFKFPVVRQAHVDRTKSFDRLMGSTHHLIIVNWLVPNGRYIQCYCAMKAFFSVHIHAAIRFCCAMVIRRASLWTIRACKSCAMVCSWH